MRSLEEYSAIVKNAVNRIKSELSTAHIDNPIKRIQPELSRVLEDTVKSMTPLVDFWRQHNLSKVEYILYIQYILPLLVSESFMKAYFLKLLIEGHNDSISWVPCGLRPDFKRITGLTYLSNNIYKGQRGQCRNNRYPWLLSIYRYTYDELFTIDLQYPQDIIREIKNCFEENAPMPQVYKMFTNLYLGRRDVPFLMFLAEVLYTNFEERRIVEYITTIIGKYTMELGTYTQGGLYLLDITYYAFGQHFSMSTFMWSAATKKNKNYDTPVLLFKTLIMKTAWPYIFAHYVTRRKQAYEMMRLTEEERSEYNERFFSAPTRRNMAEKTKVLVDPTNMIFPNGSTYAEIRMAVKRYYTVTVMPRRVIPTRKQAFKEIAYVSTQSSNIVKDIKHINWNTAVKPILASLMEEEENLLRKNFADTNLKEINSNKDVIHIYYFHKGKYAYRKIDYSVITSPDFRNEAKMFCREILKKKISPGNIQKVKQVIRFMTDLITKYQVKKCKDVTKRYICIWLHCKQRAGEKPTTIAEALCVIRNLMEVIINNKNYELRPESNPAARIRFYGTSGHVKHRPVIPDDTLLFISDHLWELYEDVRLMYQILDQTYWRFDDMANLRVHGFHEIGDQDYVGIRTVISKTRKQRIKNGIGDYLEDVITRDLYEQLQSYIEETAKIREKYGTDYVFFSCAGGMAHQVGVAVINDAINGLFERYGHKSIDQTYSLFSSSQPRATGSTALIEAGVGLSIIQNKLGHLNAETTAKHYAHVRRKKLAELDNEFFEKKFAELFDPDKLIYLTEKERMALYEDFKLNNATIEIGHCDTNPCDITCKRRGSTVCAECTKILTGPQNLPAWQKYLEESDRRLKDFKDIYDEKGITPETYSDFTEFKEELRKNQAYRDVITKIKEWIEEQ